MPTKTITLPRTTITSRKSYYNKRARELKLTAPEFRADGYPVDNWAGWSSFASTPPPLKGEVVVTKGPSKPDKSAATGRAASMAEVVVHARQLLDRIDALSRELVGLFPAR